MRIPRRRERRNHGGREYRQLELELYAYRS